MFDIITIGSATRDVFLKSKSFEKPLCFRLGTKVEVDKIIFTSGGGATNAAVTFSRLGFRCACLAKVGQDPAGQAVISDLRKEKVDTSLIQKTGSFHTAYSVILSCGAFGRAILVYRGAAEKLKAREILFSKLKAKWFYITSLGGNLTLLKVLVNFASKNKIKIALNPGSKELDQVQKLKPFLSRADLLFLNKEEAEKLLKIKSSRFKPRALIKDIVYRFCPKGIIVITCGRAGLTCFDQERFYQAGILPGKVVERTGAGDAFGSGFLAGLIMKNRIEYAIQLGSANATSTIKQIGAKFGLLYKKDLSRIRKIKVKQL